MNKLFTFVFVMAIIGHSLIFVIGTSAAAGCLFLIGEHVAAYLLGGFVALTLACRIFMSTQKFY